MNTTFNTPTEPTRSGDPTIWIGVETGQPGLRVELSPWGASWLRCEVHWPGGECRQVLLPPRSARLGPEQPRTFMGSTIGRYANRIAHGQVEHQGQRWALDRAPGERHQLHGGPGGWDTACWNTTRHSARQVTYTHTSPDGDQGYPGAAHAETHYRLLDVWTLELAWRVTVTQASPVCLSNHVYFNLDPRHPAHGDCTDVRQHRLQVAATRYAPVDAELIPLGPLAPVASTSLDFRRPHRLLDRWLQDEQQHHGAGYDHAFLLDTPGLPDQSAPPAAQLTSADGRLTLHLHTTQPALQLYTGQYLAGLPAPQQQVYGACQGLALEPQWLPDSPHHPEWLQPSVWLQPGQVWQHSAVYRFEPRD